jgi:RNA polymerase-binding transcription factor DksA
VDIDTGDRFYDEGWSKDIMSTNTYSTENPAASAGLIWGRLHAEREEICAALLEEARNLQEAASFLENDVNEESPRDVEFKHRELLQARLRQIDDALDRLLSGAYGRCSDCNESIEDKRLEADPVIAYCIACQSDSECEHHFRTL